MRGELAAVGAERVRLDQVGAGGDEAGVELHDGLGCAQVGLFRHAQAGRRARDEDAHAPVGHDHGAVCEALDEAVGHAATLLPEKSRTPHPGWGDGHPPPAVRLARYEVPVCDANAPVELNVTHRWGIK
jgi:hypothetical protein